MSDTPDNPEKAYNKGCMWGMSGGAEHNCPYAHDSELASRWQAGWQAGHQAWRKRQSAQAVG